MSFDETARTQRLRDVLEEFMLKYIYPSEERFYREASELGPWAVLPVVEELKKVARETELWNIWFLL
jgi:acyl-CoA dehydrogenase